MSDAVVIPMVTINRPEQAPQIILYTQFELYKIWFSGAMLSIAVLILTLIVYRWYMNRYRKWVYEQEVEEAKAAGKNIANIKPPVYVKPVNKPLLTAFGLFICAAGVIQYIL